MVRKSRETSFSLPLPSHPSLTLLDLKHQGSRDFRKWDQTFSETAT